MTGKNRILVAAVTLAISAVLIGYARLTGLIHSVWPMAEGTVIGAVLFQALGFIVDGLRAKRGRP